jgi:hypothetical protein
VVSESKRGGEKRVGVGEKRVGEGSEEEGEEKRWGREDSERKG